MKKISKKLLVAQMNHLFLNYCYEVSARTGDYIRECAEIDQNDDLNGDDKQFYKDNAKLQLNQKVEKASKKFNKGFAIWAYLYDGKPLMEDIEDGSK